MNLCRNFLIAGIFGICLNVQAAPTFYDENLGNDLYRRHFSISAADCKANYSATAKASPGAYPEVNYTGECTLNLESNPIVANTVLLAAENHYLPHTCWWGRPHLDAADNFNLEMEESLGQIRVSYYANSHFGLSKRKVTQADLIPIQFNEFKDCANDYFNANSKFSILYLKGSVPLGKWRGLVSAIDPNGNLEERNGQVEITKSGNNLQLKICYDGNCDTYPLKQNGSKIYLMKGDDSIFVGEATHKAMKLEWNDGVSLKFSLSLSNLADASKDQIRYQSLASFRYLKTKGNQNFLTHGKLVSDYSSFTK